MTAADPTAATSPETTQREMQAFTTASQRLNAWMGGILDATMTPRTVDEIAATTGVDCPRVADLLRALDAHGMVAREGDTYRLTPHPLKTFAQPLRLNGPSGAGVPRTQDPARCHAGSGN